jgi:hypothetical protein
MKKFSLVTTCAVAAFVLLYAPAFAGPSDPGVHLNWGSQINQSTCPSGKLVINVNQKVVNDCDSGTTRPCWALDDFVRHIQVVQVTGGFCATVSYQGNFTTIAGDSPQAVTDIGGTVGDDVVGTFEGGYRSTIFTGTLLGTPTQSTRGSIGTFDYACVTARPASVQGLWIGRPSISVRPPALTLIGGAGPTTGDSTEPGSMQSREIAVT